MSKVGIKLKKVFLSCYSNVEEQGGIDGAKDLTINAINLAIDTLVKTGKINESAGSMIKFGAAKTVTTVVDHIDEKLDNEMILMGMTPYEASVTSDH